MKQNRKRTAILAFTLIWVAAVAAALQKRLPLDPVGDGILIWVLMLICVIWGVALAAGWNQE